MPRIENWEYDDGKIYGNIFDDDRLDDGEFIRTKTIMLLNLENMTAKTPRRLFKLGKRHCETNADRGDKLITEVP